MTHDVSASASLRVLAGVRSPQLRNVRDLYVCTPPSYSSSRKRYPVVYMHDGQNLFDDALAFAEAWHVDEQMTRLARLGLEAIIVGIAHAGVARLDEYSPFRDRQLRGGGGGDAYLRFIVHTVKPLIDRRFRTQPGREHTGILGSSMGGLISLYAYFRRPETFGFAGVMSPAFWFAGKKIFSFVKSARFNPGRLYLDIGTAEGRVALADARRMNALLLRKGYTTGLDLLYVEDAGGNHSERAWSRRLRSALYFLLPRDRDA